MYIKILISIVLGFSGLLAPPIAARGQGTKAPAASTPGDRKGEETPAIAAGRLAEQLKRHPAKASALTRRRSGRRVMRPPSASSGPRPRQPPVAASSWAPSQAGLDFAIMSLSRSGWLSRTESPFRGPEPMTDPAEHLEIESMDIKSALSDAIAADVVEVPFGGHLLLERPLLNKGTAFTTEERRASACSACCRRTRRRWRSRSARAYEAYRRQADRPRAAHLPAPAPGQQRDAVLPAAARPPRRDDADRLHADGRPGLRAVQPHLSAARAGCSSPTPNATTSTRSSRTPRRRRSR